MDATQTEYPADNPQPVLRLDPGGAVLYANAPALALLQSKGWRSGEPAPPAFRELVTLAVGCRHQSEFEVLCPANPGQCGERTIAFACIPSAAKGYVTLYGHDVTEMRRVEAALRDSERRLKRSQEMARLGSWELDLRTDRLTWSDEVYRIFGLQPQEFAATYEAFLEHVHPEDRAAVDAAYSSSIREGRDTYEIEHRVVRKDTGDIRWVLERCEHGRDGEGRIVLSTGMVLDTTERKKAEAAARRSEERLRHAMAAARAGVWELDLRTGQTIWSAEDYDLYGVSRDRQPTYADWERAVDPRDLPAAREAIHAALEGQRSEYRAEFRVQHAQLGERWILAIGHVERDEAGVPQRMTGINVDITDQKEAEHEVAAAKAAAESASAAKDRFLAVLSHELRTPLAPVITALAMLQRNAALDAGTRENLEMIRRNVEMEARLIDDLLDVTRIARGKTELQRRPVRLSDIIQRTVEVVSPDIEARQLHFGVDAGDLPEAPYVVDADPTRLQQVFWNLLRNAVKFTPQGGCVGICSRRESDGYVVVEVRDSGEGIAPEAIGRIFNAFEQAERSVTRQFGGLGLGLTISKALVEQHGGTIEASSEGKGKGATFRVRLPLVSAEPQVESPPSGQAPAAGPRPLRILLVEDHGDTARVMRQLLMREGHRVERAGDVAGALQLAEQQPFDLLVSDLGLPDGSGLDLMQELRSRGRTFPGIALSGYGQEQDIRHSRQAGFAAHLTKPTNPEQLTEAIERVISGSVTPLPVA